MAEYRTINLRQGFCYLKSGIPPAIKLGITYCIKMPPKNHTARKQSTRIKLNKMNRSDEMLMKQIGLLIHKTLFESDKPVEWLSFKSGVARSSIREIIAGRSNTRILTLNALAKSLGFDDVADLLNKAKNKS